VLIERGSDEPCTVPRTQHPWLALCAGSLVTLLCSPSTQMSSASERSSIFAMLAPCAMDGTVVGTAATPGYSKPLQRLALSARRIGFGCIAVQPTDPGFPWSMPDLTDPQTTSALRALPDPPTRFLPRHWWCDGRVPTKANRVRAQGNSSRYGWRRIHVYKMRMWLVVLESGHDLLSVDLDYSLLINPLPLLRASRERSDLHSLRGRSPCRSSCVRARERALKARLMNQTAQPPPPPPPSAAWHDDPADVVTVYHECARSARS